VQTTVGGRVFPGILEGIPIRTFGYFNELLRFADILGRAPLQYNPVRSPGVVVNPDHRGRFFGGRRATVRISFNIPFYLYFGNLQRFRFRGFGLGLCPELTADEQNA